MTYLRAVRRPRMRWTATAALLASLAGLVLSQVGAADAAGAVTPAAVTRLIVAAAGSTR
jgi:hypothetical protein